MNAMVKPEDVLVPSTEVVESETQGWQMKAIKPWHKQVCALIAQGVDRQTISQIVDCTPEYISMLARQPLIKQYIQDLNSVVDVQLAMQYTKVVAAIGDTLETGNSKEKMQAARLHSELTGRIGSRGGEEEKLIDTNSRLAKLAERLLYLQGKVGGHNPSDVVEGEVVNETRTEARTEAEDGDGPL